MVIQEAIELFKKYQNGTVKKSTLKSYSKFMACDIIQTCIVRNADTNATRGLFFGKTQDKPG